MDRLNAGRHGEMHFEKNILESIFCLSPPVPSSKNLPLQNLRQMRLNVTREAFHSSGEMFLRALGTSASMLPFTMGDFRRMAHLKVGTHAHRHMRCHSERKKERTKWEKSKCQTGGSLWNMTGNTVSLAGSEQRATDTMVLINGFSDPAKIFILRQDDILSPCRLPWHKWHFMPLLFSV